jgi:hypothetical protein
MLPVAREVVVPASVVEHLAAVCMMITEMDAMTCMSRSMRTQQPFIFHEVHVMKPISNSKLTSDAQ